jgi:predicted amidophosphoribosyltransferase
MSGSHTAPWEITLPPLQPTFPRIFITTSLRNLPAGPTAFSIVHSACSYQERVKDAIHQLKHRNQVNFAEPLGKLLGKSLEVAEVDFAPECIIPIPLRHGRLKKRGDHQTLEIPGPLARKSQVPSDNTFTKPP